MITFEQANKFLNYSGKVDFQGALIKHFINGKDFMIIDASIGKQKIFDIKLTVQTFKDMII
jgi:hypothetical protein